MGRRWVPKAKLTTGFTKMIELTTPITEEQVRDLKGGEQVSSSGVVYTGRDAVHKYLHEGGALPEGLEIVGGDAASSIAGSCGSAAISSGASAVIICSCIVGDSSSSLRSLAAAQRWSSS